MKYIKGNFRKNIFKSAKGYVIGLFKVRDTDDDAMRDFINKTITFTGYFHDLNENDTYFFYGELVENSKYGLQYQVASYEKIRPDNVEGVIEFLSSDLFAGIGFKIAKEIVDVLGCEAIDKIINNRHCLDGIAKLSVSKADRIFAVLSNNENGHKTTVYLTELGFSMRDAFLIYNVYKADTIRSLEYNLYDVIDKIPNISFERVDQIARKMNIDNTDDNRIKACIVYVMKQVINKKGDLYLERKDITLLVNKYLRLTVDDEKFSLYFSQLEESLKIVIDNDKYYLHDIYDDEMLIVERIKYLVAKEKSCYDNLTEAIDTLQKTNNIVYNDSQRDAIKRSLENNITIITGGPGTGKTTIIKAITSLYGQINNLNYEQLEEVVALLAPTGRASKRMSEATLLSSMTIHRFLKWDKDSNTFGVNLFEKDYSKLIIIDEVSMIDLSLLANLFKGLTNDIKIILVGDYNQLPSVGPGQILKDLIECEVIDTVMLSLLYRQDEDSYISSLALEIKDNNLSEDFLQPRSDYKFLTCSSDSICSNLKKICKQIYDKGFDYKTVQVMAPMYAGVNGIDNLNKELQNIFNPQDNKKKEIIFGDVIFRENDKILQLVNKPEENIFNGDIGVIKNIILPFLSKSGKNEMEIDFDGHVVRYLTKDFISIKHGFVITIHKSQGSEFNTVIIPVCSSYQRMLYRKLIYTGITRAKRRLILLGEPSAFVRCVSNDNEYVRKTMLVERLKNF